MNTSKTCSKCGVEKGLDQFSPNKGGALGVRGRCKSCSAADKAARTDKAAAAEAARRYRAANPEKSRESVRKYRAKNRTKAKVRHAEYVKKHPSRKQAWNRKAYEKDRDARIEYAKQWQKDNPDKVTARTARRRAKMLQACPPWVDQAKIIEVYAEAARLTLETGIPHHVDHIAPLQGRNVCGLHVPWNLRVIPATENKRKSNRFDGGW